MNVCSLVHLLPDLQCIVWAPAADPALLPRSHASTEAIVWPVRKQCSLHLHSARALSQACRCVSVSSPDSTFMSHDIHGAGGARQCRCVDCPGQHAKGAGSTQSCCACFSPGTHISRLPILSKNSKCLSWATFAPYDLLAYSSFQHVHQSMMTILVWNIKLSTTISRWYA